MAGSGNDDLLYFGSEIQIFQKFGLCSFSGLQLIINHEQLRGTEGLVYKFRKKSQTAQVDLALCKLELLAIRIFVSDYNKSRCQN